MPENPNAVAMLAAIDVERLRVHRLLESADEQALVQRPPSGEWSPIENVRHLLFAEQLHFYRLLPEKQEFDARGLAAEPFNPEPPFQNVGTEPTTDIAEVLKAWDAVHAPAAGLASSSHEKLDATLDFNLKHLRFHVAIIESLLSGGTGCGPIWGLMESPRAEGAAR